MPFTLKRLAAGDEAVFARIGPDVFDEPIHPERMAAYLRAPGHIMVLALEGDLVVGQCAAVVTRGSDFETMVRKAGRRAERFDLPEASAPTPEMIEALTKLCAENGIDLVGPPLS